MPPFLTLVSVQGDPAVLGVPWVPCRDLGLSANPLAALGCCLVAASSLRAPQAAAPQHHFQVTRQSRPKPANEDAAEFVPTYQRGAGVVNPCAASASDDIEGMRGYAEHEFQKLCCDWLFVDCTSAPLPFGPHIITIIIVMARSVRF